MNATEFYDKCDLYNKGEGDGITIADCMPSRNHNRTTINEKCSCCAEILHIQDAKYMKVGLKDKISQYVDFTYGYGNEATLGFKVQNDTSSVTPEDVGLYDYKWNGVSIKAQTSSRVISRK